MFMLYTRYVLSKYKKKIQNKTFSAFVHVNVYVICSSYSETTDILYDVKS